MVLFCLATHPLADFFKVAVHRLLGTLWIPCPKCLDQITFQHHGLRVGLVAYAPALRQPLLSRRCQNHVPTIEAPDRRHEEVLRA